MIGFSTGYIIVNVICTIIGLATILCNSLAAMLILKKKRHWDNSLTFILHLCIADDFAGVLILWNVIYNINGHRNFFECVFRSSAISGVIFTSCFVLLGLSVDRYIKITAPFRSAQLENGRWVKVYVGGQWALFFTVCLGIPALTWINHVIPYCDCGFFIVLKREYLLALTSFIAFALLCQCFIYGHVFYIAMSKGNLQYALYSRHKSIFNSNDKLKIQPFPSRQVLRTTRAVLFVCGLNLLTSLPVGVYVYLVSTNQLSYIDHHTQGDILVYVATPLYLNSFINPFLYAFKIPDIRRTLSHYLPCFRSRINPHGTTGYQTHLSVIELK
ncbi:adenosine receptor A3 [Magallana gigas]|uniref:adenosine receptor A3 n=1 Tax=Magallana gigas TaxID=29159 RepID=UPI00333E6A22